MCDQVSHRHSHPPSRTSLRVRRTKRQTVSPQSLVNVFKYLNKRERREETASESCDAIDKRIRRTRFESRKHSQVRYNSLLMRMNRTLKCIFTERETFLFSPPLLFAIHFVRYEKEFEIAREA